MQKPTANPHVPKILDRLHRLPTSHDLQHLLDESSKYRNESVLLPWQSGESQYFGIGVTFPGDPYVNSPRWVFYSELLVQPKVMWVYETSDVSLIHNMLLCAFADEVLAPEAHNSYAYITKQAGAPVASSAVWIDPKVGQTPHDSLPILTGTLQKLQIDVLLQSLGSSKLTGKVQVRFQHSEGVIFFADGLPVHCECGGEEGSDAMLELLTWRVGDFEVYEDEASSKQTIKKRMQTMLMESAALMDYRHFLAAQRIDGQSILAVNTLTHEEYVERTRDGVPVNEDKQRALAARFDGKTTVSQAAKALQMSAVYWTPLIYNMVKCGLVRKLAGTRLDTIESKDHPAIDREAGHEIHRMLTNGATGFYSAAAFVFHLNSEFARFSAHRRPFALAVIQVKKEPGQKFEIETLTETIASLRNILRPSDLLCHFDKGYAIILPETEKEYAEAMVLRIVNGLSEFSQAKHDLSNVWMKIGSAAVPSDSESLAQLVSAALHKDNSSVLRF